MLTAYCVLKIVNDIVPTLHFRIVNESEKVTITDLKQNASDFFYYPLPHENGLPINSLGQTLDINEQQIEVQGRKIDDVIKGYFERVSESYNERILISEQEAEENQAEVDSKE